MTIFSTHYVFQELETRKTINIGCEQNELYERKLASDQVACSVLLQPLPVLKLLVPSLGHVSSLECESCQLGKHHRLSYPNRVNKKVDKPFDLVHSNV